VLLFWFYLSFFIVLLGAEINAERELRTGQPTRSDAPREMADPAAVPSSQGEA
jgi:membrane protein